MIACIDKIDFKRNDQFKCGKIFQCFNQQYAA